MREDRGLLVHRETGTRIGPFASQMDAMQALALSDAPKSWAVVRPDDAQRRGRRVFVDTNEDGPPSSANARKK